MSVSGRPREAWFFARDDRELALEDSRDGS